MAQSHKEVIWAGGGGGLFPFLLLCPPPQFMTLPFTNCTFNGFPFSCFYEGGEAVEGEGASVHVYQPSFHKARFSQ